MKKIHYLILAVVTAALLSGFAISYFWMQLFPIEPLNTDSMAGDSARTIESTSTESTAPQVWFRCPLDDETTTAERSQRRPIAVMVENHPDARPQSGLIKACTVYETVAEGGVTRFMPIFVHDDAVTIGPVRSAREYFVDLAKQYDAIYSHCGGPATVYPLIKSLNVADLDEFSNGDAYWRLKTRKAPHNLYSTTEKLRKRAAERGYKDQVFFQKPNFKEDVPFEERPEHASIDINFSRPLFAVHYEYNRQTNTYNRFMAGKPHIDGAYNQLISPKNVVVQYNPISQIADDPKGRMKVNMVGTGQAIVFQDGKAIQAIWQRPALSELTRFYDGSGSEIKFNEGQTWIEIVDPQQMQVTFK